MTQTSRGGGPRGWRCHYAAALYATGVPVSLVALALGDFMRPVSTQRVYQLLDRAGLDWRQHPHTTPSVATVDAAIDAARASGLIRRGDIFRDARARLGLASGPAYHRVRARLVSRFGKARYIPPPGTPTDWRYCIHCQAFAPPSGWGGHCPAHYNAYMRESRMARRRALGKPTIGSRAGTYARARAAAAAVRDGRVSSISAAQRQYQVSRAVIRRYLREEPA